MGSYGFIFTLLWIGCRNFADAAVDTNAAFLRYNYNMSTASVPGTPVNYTLSPSEPFVYFNLTEAKAALSLLNTMQFIIPDICATDSPCDANGVCTPYGPSVAKCSCPSGFQQGQSTARYRPYNTTIPDGTYCPDIDECTPTNATLCGAETVTCNNTVGSYFCTCSANYYFNNATMMCEDVDECNNSSLNNCSSTGGVCINTPGSFSCACASGFTGDGVNCIDTIDCVLGNTTICGAETFNCTDTAGSYMCACNAGYAFDSSTFLCDDEDECFTGNNNCDTNATCGNTVGSFTCTCNTGYSGDGVTCADIDECGASPCHVDAACKNTPGSFSCACNLGFTGNGTYCIASSNDFCYRAVVNISGAATVSGSTVSDVITIINELTSFTHSTVNATVDNTVSGPTSQFVISYCFTGASGTPDELTALLVAHSVINTLNALPVTSITDYDECTSNYDNCSPNAVCTNTNGSFTCACPQTYADLSATGEVGTTCTFPVNFTCYSDRIEVWALASYFQAKGVYNQSMLVLGNNCIGTNDSSGYWKFNGTCNANVTTNGTHVLRKWNLAIVYGVIVTGSEIVFPLACSFSTSQNVSIDFNATQPVINAPEVNNPLVSTTFTAQIYSDASLKTPLTGSVKTSDQLYFKVGSTGSNLWSSKFVMVVKEFWTASAEDISKTLPLIENYCPVTKDGNNDAILNSLSFVSGVSGDVIVSVQAHFQQGSSTTTSFFVVEICNPTTTNCTRTCSGAKRRKRSLHYQNKRDVSGTASVSYSRDPEDVCRKDCGGGLCVLDAKLIQQCVCLEGTVKHSDGTCQKSSQDEDKITTTEDRTILWLIVALAVLLLLLIAVALAVFLVRQKKDKQKEYSLTHINDNDLKSKK